MNTLTPTLTDLLQAVADVPADYPPDLLAARRASFREMIEAMNDPRTPEQIDTGKANAHEVAIATTAVNLANCKPAHRWYYTKRLQEEQAKAVKRNSRPFPY